jgi:hypothetical protein
MNTNKTFCASPDCKNECGRKMSDEMREQMIRRNQPYVSYAYFCGEPPASQITNTFKSKDDS